MSESARKRQRTTPRNSVGPDSNLGTPHADLQRLAGVIPKPVTPFRRAASTGPTPGSRRTPNFTIRTPGTGRTPRGGPATRPIPTRRTAPTTPHAIRALRERANAARTPGHNRRRSGRIQRETPRDILRDLSRALAPSTRPLAPDTQVTYQRTRHSALDLPDVEDGQDLTAPRLSMPLEDMYEDDSFHEAPPRQSLLPELPDDVDNTTMQSLEFGRRALSEDPRYAGRVSERFAEMNDLDEEEEYEVDGTFINRRRTLGVDQLVEQDLDDDALGDGDTTMEIRALTGNRSGRQSDVNLGVFGEDDDVTEEPTFRFMIPERMRVPAQEEADEGDELKDEEPSEQLIDAPFEQEDDNQVQLGDDIPQNEETTRLEDQDAASRLAPTTWESDPEEDSDIDLTTYREEPTAIDRSLLPHSPEKPRKSRPGRQRRAFNISKVGLEYPSFPPAPVKSLALGFMKSQGVKGKLSKETLAALVQTTDFFFEQVGEDLAAYSKHGGRKTIEESDVVALMKRTRQITSNTTSFSLAQKMLPRELLQHLRMEPLPKMRQKRKRMETIQEEEEDG